MEVKNYPQDHPKFQRNPTQSALPGLLQGGCYPKYCDLVVLGFRGGCSTSNGWNHKPSLAKWSIGLGAFDHVPAEGMGVGDVFWMCVHSSACSKVACPCPTSGTESEENIANPPKAGFFLQNLQPQFWFWTPGCANDQPSSRPARKIKERPVEQHGILHRPWKNDARCDRGHTHQQYEGKPACPRESTCQMQKNNGFHVGIVQK